MSSPIVEIQKPSAITLRQKFEGHTDVVLGVIHLPDGQRMMTYAREDSVKVWNLKSGKQIGNNWRDSDGVNEVWTIALSPDSKKVVGGSDDGGVRLWDIDTGKVTGRWMGHTKRVRPVCWSQDSRRVLSGSYDGTARQWDVEKGETILAPINTGHERVLAVIYSPDTTMFATGGCDTEPDFEHIMAGDNKSTVKIWDAKTGELVATLKGHTHAVICLAWTPDGELERLISGSLDSSIRIWDTTTWKQIAVLEGHTSVVYDIAISPNGRILASASDDETARLWNLDNNQPISSPLEHAQAVFSVSFSTDGKLLATGCGDENAYTWDVSAIVKEVGLDELLLDQPDKSVVLADAIRSPVQPFDLSADATRRPVRQPIKVHQGFFDDIPDRAHVSARHRLRPWSWASHVSSLHGQFSSLFHPVHPDAHDASSRPRPEFHWVRNRLPGRRSGEEIKLHKRRSAVVDVPYAHGKRRNASAREKRRVIIPLKPKNLAASTSHPPNSNVTQQSSGGAQDQTSLHTQAAVSPSSIALPIANTISHTNPRATVENAGRWTRFWLFFCCASPEYTHDHH